MAFTSVTYVSKILWRFFGGSSPGNPTVGLKDIQYIFHEDKIVLTPYNGKDGKSDRYIRQITFQDESSQDSMATSPDGNLQEDPSILYAEEPKAVCYCDIPINHLALHMKKYNTVGIGIDRDLLARKSADLQPVRYYFIREKKDFDKEIEGVFSIVEKNKETDKTILLEKYIKIPTLFRGNASVSTTLNPNIDGLDLSEGFNSIYEEREWKHFDPVELKYNQISFILLPSRKYLENAGKLHHLLDAKVGIIYADELFPNGEL